MTYYILHNSNGELVGINYTGLPTTEPLFGVSVIEVNQDPPNLKECVWNSETLSLDLIPKPIVTRLEFMSKFTTAERIAIQNSSDLVVKDALDLLQLAEFIDLTDPRTIAAVNYFSQIGLLDQSRINEILI